MAYKRLMKIRSQKVVAGVCAGLGEYFGIDPVFFRVGFAFGAFFFAMGLLLYIILVIAMPFKDDDAPRN